jgi:hypothetical protein
MMIRLIPCERSSSLMPSAYCHAYDLNMPNVPGEAGEWHLSHNEIRPSTIAPSELPLTLYIASWMIFETKQESYKYRSRNSRNCHSWTSKDVMHRRFSWRLRKLRSAPAHEGLTPQPQNLTPPSATQLEVISRCYNQPESRKSSSPSPTGDEEPTSNDGAAYQEWPMRGFFKLITIRNEVRYGMEFSLEDVQQLCAAAFPLHTSSAGSNATFSARPSRRAQPFSACARAENAPSRSKRPRFTEEEDARLVDLKQRGWLWEDIQRSFLGRSTGSLQVRYSTKLKERNTAS